MVDTSTERLAELAATDVTHLEAGAPAALSIVSSIMGGSWADLMIMSKTDDLGWIPVAVLHQRDDPVQRRIVAKWFKRSLKDTVFAPKILAEAGTPRAWGVRERLTAQEWESSVVRVNFAELKMSDKLVGVWPAGPIAEVGVSVSRAVGMPVFTADDEALMVRVMRTISRYCQCLAVSYGVTHSTKPFTPREREVFKLLLGGASQKEAAAVLGIKEGSAHQIVVRVFRKLGVRSRPELMALWARGGAEANTEGDERLWSFP